MAFRINTAADLAAVNPVDNCVISMPTTFVGDPSDGEYDADTEALWAAIQADLEAKGWEWTGSAGIEEDGSGDWMVFRKTE
tara:strand:+ start:1008 stop:1250 length:243 start_codon:yes stop_codon:yes gene_type:complete